MIKNYSIFDTSTLKIRRRVVCDDSLILNNLGSQEGYVEGHVDESQYKVDASQTGFEELTDTEKDDYLFAQREHLRPPNLDFSLSDAIFNQIIDDYFLGRVDVETWRINNYVMLRRLAYPDKTEKLDAEVKINSGIDSLVAEGTLQLQSYVEDCLNVKVRFPKE